MSRTYKAIGINLKSIPFGEADRLLTVLTREFGLIRAVAVGARKQNSKLGGRSGLFVVNDLLIAKGRSLDKITQAETLESHPKLGGNLKKLTAGQYLAELTLQQALSDQPQDDLFYLLNEHLARLERSPSSEVLAHLCHGVFQLLVLAGIAPQVHQCCVTQTLLTPDLDSPTWQAGFSTAGGGAVTLDTLEQLQIQDGKGTGNYIPSRHAKKDRLNTPIGAIELSLLQELAAPDLPPNAATTEEAWFAIERLLRHYAHYHFDQPIRSAVLIDSCFAPALFAEPSA